jgi:selenocysteine lyase/cysteine desulfurase
MCHIRPDLRVSIGPSNDEEDVERLVAALAELL